MDIEKAIGEITQHFKEETPESVKATLENVKREFGQMQVSLSAVNTESKGRKETIRKLQDELDEALSKVSKLSDDTQMKEMQANYDSKISELTTEKENLLKSQNALHEIFRKEVANEIEKIKEHPNFEKVKTQIKLPEIKDNKFDFTKLSTEDVLFNKNKLSEYQALGLFESKLEPPGIAQTPRVEKFEDIDIVELAKTNPLKAREILDKRRGRNVLFKT